MVRSHHVQPKDIKEDIFRNILVVHYTLAILMYYGPNRKLSPPSPPI